MADPTAIAPNEGSSFSLPAYHLVKLTFVIPLSNSPNGRWQVGEITANFGTYGNTVVPGYPSGISANGTIQRFYYDGYDPASAGYSGPDADPQTTISRNVHFYFSGNPYEGYATFSNVLLTLTPYPPPTATPTQVSPFYVCKGGRFAPAWNVTGAQTVSSGGYTNADYGGVTVTDDSGNNYPVTVSSPDQSGTVRVFSIAPQTITKRVAYTISVVGMGGEVVTSTIVADVVPFSVSLTLTPKSITACDPVTLTWSSVHADYVDFYVQLASGGPNYKLDARGSGYGAPALTKNGQGYPNFWGFQIGSYPNGWNYPADCYPSGSVVIYPQASCTITAIAHGGCGTVSSDPVSVTVTYPEDDSTATGIISVAAGYDSGGVLGGSAPQPLATGAVEIDKVRHWQHLGVNATGASLVKTNYTGGGAAFAGPAIKGSDGKGMDQWVRFRANPHGGKLLLLGSRGLAAGASGTSPSGTFTLFLSTDGGVSAVQVISMAASTALIEVLPQHEIVVLLKADSQSPPHISVAQGTYTGVTLAFGAAVPAMLSTAAGTKPLTGILMDTDYDTRTDTLYLVTDGGPLRSKDCGLTWNT